MTAILSHPIRSDAIRSNAIPRHAIPSDGDSDFAVGSPLIERPSRTRRASRAFIRYLIAIGIGVAGTLAWQSYGDAAKQMIATNAPQLGWSPEAQQMIAGWVEEFGWTKEPAASEKTASIAANTQQARPPQAGTQQAASQAGTPQAAVVAQTAPAMAPLAPAAASLEQVQQIAADLAALHQTVDQLTAGQDQMTRDVTRDMAKMQAANEAILQKVSAPPPPKVAAPPLPAAAPIAHKHMPAWAPSAAPLPLR
jgi:hypothetical protein